MIIMDMPWTCQYLGRFEMRSFSVSKVPVYALPAGVAPLSELALEAQRSTAGP